MSVVKIVGIALMVAAALALAYGGFTASDRREVQVGTINMTVTDRRTLAVPMWAAMAALVLGGALLFVPAKRA
jgi:TRAP-type C4-dicarboxylate transport system permease small subunit